MSLHYQEYGDKNASLMVFLHGGGVSSWMWNKQIKHFSHYHCLAIDLPEQGKSDNIENFTIRNSAERIIELIEKLAYEKQVIVIGFSLGAQVTIQMLSMKPSLIHYTIINSALVRPSPFIKKMIAPSIKLTFPLIKNKKFSKLQAKTLYLQEEYFETYYKESSSMKSETLVRILEENISFQIPEGFHKAECNILVTVGAREKTIMKKSAKDIVSSNTNCVGMIIPKVGHGISLANPDYFNVMIENWIEDGVLLQVNKS
ncbi:alpha/beta hydrolase [Salipaludibacillus neizhouensis]|uniref:Alpha/beta hydrolase n=1 Tax=Salipaludibacillus neizhouensis TaxID=885475 RepID=A0A3A9KE33_9BACI|nr:alpha/beta hydrolase [Salipaludibacillus neizhouensis]RKL65755.1 alpha/beta hydrolase [Salipaludibacillus neizhouensis]